MDYSFEINGIKYTFEYGRPAPVICKKIGNSLIAFPKNFVVVDLETTGFSPTEDEIIEISCIRVRDFKVIDNFTTLIKPTCELDSFISNLTGITDAMLENAPMLETVLPNVLDFIGDDIVVGWNVRFDINFIYVNSERILNREFTNDYINAARIARKLYPDLQSWRLYRVANYLDIDLKNYHRSMGDCNATLECFSRMRKDALEKYTSIEDFNNAFKKKNTGLDARTISTDKTEFDETNPLYGKVCVFTGVLERMERRAAMQIVLDLGGQCANGITKKTNFLILGNNDYCSSIKGGKSNKQKKAEEYKLNGCDIEIIPEDVFYDMIQE